MLILSALQNGLVEEVLVIGYLLRRLDQLGFRNRRAIAISATLRGSYHLYQGFGGFIGNAVMGVIFARAVPALGPGHPAGHRAHADRHGRLHRLRRTARPRGLAAVTTLAAFWDRVTATGRSWPPGWSR